MANKFVMNTAVFCEIWKNHLRKSGADDWKKFVAACFERFAARKDHEGNVAALVAKDANWESWTDKQKYDFLNPKCYSKCISIQRKLKTEEKLDIDLPQGYKDRNGAKTKRLSTRDLANIFRG